MYHCHVSFYLIGSQRGIFDTVKQMPPLENFAHSFAESERPEATLLAQADVVLADVQGMDAEAALGLSGEMKPGAQLIVLAGREQVPALARGGSAIQDIWVLPMPEEEARFRFLKWQQGCKLAKDCWQTEQFLDGCMEATPQLIWYKNKDGAYKKVNSSFCKMAGKSQEQVRGKTYADIWTAKPDPVVIQSEQKVVRTGKNGVSHETIQTGEDEVLLNVYRSPLRDLDGSVMGTVGIAMDITRQQAYEQEIIAKSQVMEMLFSSMDCGVMCHSVDGSRILSINEAALMLLDYRSREEVLADGFNLVAQSVLDEDKPKLRECIKSLKKTGDSASVEYRVLHRDGKVLHILGNVKLLEQDGEPIYERFLLDLTDQKRREEERWAKKDQEFRYQERLFDIFSTFLSDNVDDVYMMLDETGRSVEFVTPNIVRVLGIPVAEILHDANAIGHAEYVTGYEVGNAGLAALEPGMALEPMETKRIHRKTGEEKWFHESVYCVSVQGVKKIIVYISDRTREQRVQNFLAEALEMAQVASKAKSAFLSNVSHDIRTPMNAIIGFISLLKEEPDNPAQVLDYAQRIDAASQHLLGLINDVLDINKIESGSATLNVSEVNLAEVVDEINAIIRPQAKRKDQTFDILVSSLEYEHLLGDKLRINQILINLLSNAVKYTPEGGHIEVWVEELPQVVESHSRVRFTVRDNGLGMSEEYQKVIFDPFSREETSVKRQIQGTGLGMAITKSLVDLMGGTIRVASTPGEGSTFTVELELRIQECEDDKQFWTDHRVGKMIVTDDNEETCRNIVHVMQGTGVAVDYSTDGATAIQMIREAREAGAPYDLILLDWKMPGLDGLETARLIRKNYPDKIPILLLTAYDWSDIEQEATELGIRHFLPKPFFMSNFKEAVQRMQGDRQSPAQPEEKRSAVSGLNALVVDDIEVNRIILTKILTTLGAQCESASNGQEALEMFAGSRPGHYGIIFMDVQMPVMDGYEATRAIRASSHPEAQSVPIIAMTANAFMDDIRNALEAGMDAHVPKPIVLDQMEATVQEVLSRKGRLGR